MSDGAITLAECATNLSPAVHLHAASPAITVEAAIRKIPSQMTKTDSIPSQDGIPGWPAPRSCARKEYAL